MELTDKESRAIWSSILEFLDRRFMMEEDLSDRLRLFAEAIMDHSENKAELKLTFVLT